MRKNKPPLELQNAINKKDSESFQLKRHLNIQVRKFFNSIETIWSWRKTTWRIDEEVS